MARDRTILLVDELHYFRELGALFLARSGSVVCAGSADEALALARAHPPDVVITDLHMPERDGAELCRAIRADATLHRTPVVIVISGDDPADHERAVRAGASDLLTKPLSRYALLESVARLTHPRRPQGQPRVPLAEPVELCADGATHRGTLRNLSRGGVFVDSAGPVRDGCDVALDFRLPGSGTRIHPTAQVVWRTRPLGADASVGLGMRFLALDAASVHALEDFVFENAERTGLDPAATGATP